MSATISYANAAAKASSETETSVELSTSIDQTTNEASSSTNVDEQITSEATDAVSEENAESTSLSDDSKPKKTLAPAPIPSKSVWSASASSAPKDNIDEQLWPTADKLKQTEQQASQPQKFIKPITNKWVPLPAKVVISGGKPGGKSQPRNRKSKKSNQGNGQGGSGKKNSGGKKKEDDEDVEGDDEKKFGKQQQAINGKRYSSQNGSQFKGSSKQQGGSRTGSNSGAHPPQGQFANNGGFYHPQPFVPNGANFGGRQFRVGSNGMIGQGEFPIPGQYPPMNGYGFYPQVQIPPPISPKQDPEQALVQQIDYYFSLENLIRDIFLRKNMSEEGWVSLKLILDFKRVKIIINGIQNLSEEPFDLETTVRKVIKACENLDIKYLNDKNIETAEIEDIELRVKDGYQQWLLSSH